MQLLSPAFLRPNYNQRDAKTPSAQVTQATAMISALQTQPTETFTKTPRFSGLNPYTDSQGNKHEYLQTDIDEDALPHADTVFKESAQQYNAMYPVFYLAAYIGDAEKVEKFLKKGYDPTIRKSTDEPLCTMRTRNGRDYDAPYWLPSKSKGKSARDLAEMKKHTAIVALMDNRHQLVELPPRKTTIKFQLPSNQPDETRQSQPAESPVVTAPKAEKDSKPAKGSGLSRVRKIIHSTQNIFTP